MLPINSRGKSINIMYSSSGSLRAAPAVPRNADANTIDFKTFEDGPAAEFLLATLFISALELVCFVIALRVRGPGRKAA